MSLFLFITDINEFFETRTPPPPFFDHPFIKFNKYVRPPPLLTVYFNPPIIRCLRVPDLTKTMVSAVSNPSSIF